MKLNLLTAVGIVILLSTCAIAKDKAPAPAKAEQPINAMLAAMAKGDGISESEAKTVALEVCKRLWGAEPNTKVESCKLDKDEKLWTVVVWSPHPQMGMRSHHHENRSPERNQGQTGDGVKAE